MALPLILAGAALVGLVIACSSEDEAENSGGPTRELETTPNQDAATSAEKKPTTRENKEPVCLDGSDVYAFKTSEGPLTVCHQDGVSKPKIKPDQVFQSASEGLSFIVGEKSEQWNSQGFQKFSEKFQFPNFANLNLREWHGIYQKIFPEGASLKEFQAFNRLVEDARKNGIDLEKAFALAQNIPNYDIKEGKSVKKDWMKSSPYEKFLSFQIGVLLLEMQKDSSFYQAKNSKGVKENKKFVDTVIKNIQDGKLSLRDIRGKKERFPHEFEGAEAYYHSLVNAIQIPKDFFDSGGVPKVVLVHELYHFYQDIHKLEDAHQMIEMNAFLKGAEFEVEKYLKNVPQEKLRDTPTLIADFFSNNQVLKDLDPESTGRLAAEIVFYSRQGDSQKVEVYRNKLLLKINSIYYLGELEKQAVPEVQKTLDRLVDPANVASFYSRGLDSDQIIKEANIQRKHFLGLIAEQMREGPKDNSKQFEKDMAERYYKTIYYTALLVVFEIKQKYYKTGKEPTDEEWAKDFKKGMEETQQLLAGYYPMQYGKVKADGV